MILFETSKKTSKSKAWQVAALTLPAFTARVVKATERPAVMSCFEGEKSNSLKNITEKPEEKPSRFA